MGATAPLFTFTLGGVDYAILLVNMGDDDLLACQFEANGDRKFRALKDTHELISPAGKYYNNEEAFWNSFMVLLNGSLTKAHSNGDPESLKPIERLIAFIKTKVVFEDGQLKVK